MGLTKDERELKAKEIEETFKSVHKNLRDKSYRLQISKKLSKEVAFIYRQKYNNYKGKYCHKYHA